MESVLIQERNQHPARQLRFTAKHPSQAVNPAGLVFFVSPDTGRRKKKRSAFPCFSSKEFKKKPGCLDSQASSRHPAGLSSESQLQQAGGDTTPMITQPQCILPRGTDSLSCRNRHNPMRAVFLVSFYK